MSEERPRVIPGDPMAIAEEYLPGPHAYDDGTKIRALVVGTENKDQSKREISVRPKREADVLRVGDYVVGQVEAAQTSSAAVRILFVNGKQSYKGFSGSLSMRSGPPGRGRGAPPVKSGDLVRCRISSLVNGMIHLSMNEDTTGVIRASCSNCGSPLLSAGSRLKCDECGNVEERRLARDFGQSPIRP